MARLVLADLDQSIQIIQRKYPDAPMDQLKRQVPEGALEWVAKLIHERKLRWPEDLRRLMAAYQYFLQNRGNSKFQQAAKNKGFIQPKNLLNYTLHDMEGIETDLQPKKSKRKEIEEHKQRGAKLFYDKAPYKIIQIGGPDTDLESATQAACYYAKETRWCTSDPATAKSYLESSPLYVLFKDNVKIAQMDPNTGQFMDVRDQEIEPSPELKRVVRDSGLYHQMFSTPKQSTIELQIKLTAEPDPELEQRLLQNYLNRVVWSADPIELICLYTREVRGRQWPEAKKFLLENFRLPMDLTVFANTVGRWPEAEPIIAESAQAAYFYVVYVIKGPWPEGENAIKQNTLPLVYSYVQHFRKTPWPAFENRLLIRREYDYAVKYATEVKKGRWPELEKIILEIHDPGLAYNYTRHVPGVWDAHDKGEPLATELWNLSQRHY